jgi:SH3 domain protein
MAVLFCALLTFGGHVNAESAWVTDLLQLGVSEAPDANETPFAFLQSADSVEVLERSIYYARVRMKDGREGWVLKNFLVDKPPARLLVETTQKKLNQTASELKSLQRKFDQQRSQLKELEKKISADENAAWPEQGEFDRLRTAYDELKANFDELRVTYNRLRAEIDTYRFSLPMIWALIGIVLSLVAGFLAGWWWLDNRIRMRHGGVRIY